jgi:hypothetical protein
VTLLESVATGKTLLLHLSGLQGLGNNLAGLPLPSHTSLVEELRELLRDLTKREIPPLDLRTILRGCLRADMSTTVQRIQDLLIVDRATISNPALTLVARPFYRIYTQSYSNVLGEAAELVWGKRLERVDPTLDLLPPSQDRLQVVSLSGDVSRSPLLHTPDYFALEDGPLKTWYEQLFAEAATRPVLVLAEDLEESDWRLLDMLGADEQARHVLVPSEAHKDRLTYAGYDVMVGSLEDLVSRKIPANTEQVAIGSDRLTRLRARSATAGGVQLVANLLSVAPTEDGRFLAGYQPTWSDIVSPHFVASDRYETIMAAARLDSPGQRRVVIVEGQAGAGKSGTLMLLAKHLTNDLHLTVAWIDRTISQRLKTIRREVRELAPAVLLIDDIDMFGERASSLCYEFAGAGGTVVIASIRSSRKGVLRDVTDDFVVRVPHPPTLSTRGIDELIAALSHFGLLGILRQLPASQRAAYVRDECDSDLLATLVQIVTGERLKARVVSELADLTEDARSIYSLICFLSSVVYEEPETLDSDLFQISSELPPYPRTRRVIDELEEYGLVRYDRVESSGLRARHRVIAELVTSSMSHTEIVRMLSRTARYFAGKARLDAEPASTSRRQIIRLMSHNVMLDLGLSLEEARAVYRSLQAALWWDFHFWLQRAAYEAERGDLALASNYLEQAKGCDGGKDDFKVLTQAGRVALLRSARNPGSGELRSSALEHLQVLKRVATDYGPETPHTFAVLAREGVNWCIAQRGLGVDVGDIVTDIASQVEYGVTCCRGNPQLTDAVEWARPRLSRLRTESARFPLI